jgi:hypothetical protein
VEAELVEAELAEAELAEAELVRRSWRSAELVESAQAAAELWWRRSWRRRSYGGGGAVAEAELAATPTELAEAEAGAGGSGAAGAGGGGAGDRTTDYGAGRSGMEPMDSLALSSQESELRAETVWKKSLCPCQWSGERPYTVSRYALLLSDDYLCPEMAILALVNTLG